MEHKHEKTMILSANAKINLSLAVLSRRADGYHELDMLTQSIGLSDTLILRENDAITLELTAEEPIPNDRRNLAFKAAQALQTEYRVQQGVAIKLVKRIPSGAGLGGGSADAAAILCGLHRLWKLALSDGALEELAIALGADVPFCLHGGLARVRGIGEKLTAIPRAPAFPLVVVKPDVGLSTAAVFSAYDALSEKPTNPCIDSAIEALSGQTAAFAKTLGNALQQPAASLLPEISECVQTLQSLGALKAQMTGSGSAVFGLFSSFAEAQKAYAHCLHRWKQTYLTKTVASGVTHEIYS